MKIIFFKILVKTLYFYPIFGPFLLWQATFKCTYKLNQWEVGDKWALFETRKDMSTTYGKWRKKKDERHNSTLFNNIGHYSTIFNIFWKFKIIQQYSESFDNIRHDLTSFVLFHCRIMSGMVKNVAAHTFLPMNNVADVKKCYGTIWGRSSLYTLNQNYNKPTLCVQNLAIIRKFWEKFGQKHQICDAVLDNIILHNLAKFQLSRLF